MGLREPRERGCGVKLEEGTSALRRGSWGPRPPGRALNASLWPVSPERRPGPRGGAVQSPSAVGGRLDRAESPGGRLGRSENPPLPAEEILPPPRGPAAPPGHLEGGRGENQHTEGCPQLPRAARTRVASSCPSDNGREGEKRVKKLGRRAEWRGEARGRDRAAANSAAEGGARLRAGGERGAQSQPRRHCSRAPNSGGSGGGRLGGGGGGGGRGGGTTGPTPARGLASAAELGSAANRRGELTGAPGEDGAAGAFVE